MSLHIASYTRDWYRYCVIVVRLMIIIEILKYSKICYLCEKCHTTLYHRMMSSHQFRELVFTIHRLFISVDIMQHYTILYTMYTVHCTVYIVQHTLYTLKYTWQNIPGSTDPLITATIFWLCVTEVFVNMSISSSLVELLEFKNIYKF